MFRANTLPLFRAPRRSASRRRRRGVTALLIVATLMPVCAAVAPANAAGTLGGAARTLVVSSRFVPSGPPSERVNQFRPGMNWTDWLGRGSLASGPAALHVKRIAHLHACTGSRGR
jgi:hypothetical protein